MSKYHNTKSGGFDSIKERRRWKELQLLQKAGQICGLDRQVRFDLIPAQYEGKKCIYRGVSYYADFTYWENGVFVVEDCKGFRTDVYKLKAKMMYYFHHIKIKET